MNSDRNQFVADVQRVIRDCLAIDPTPAETGQRIMDALKQHHALTVDKDTAPWLALLVLKWHTKTPDLDVQAEKIANRIIDAAHISDA